MNSNSSIALLSGQFLASIAMLRNPIELFPSENWSDEKPYWYFAYHCLFFTDFYLTKFVKDFDPPFGFGEFEEVYPDPRPTRTELLGYAEAMMKKCTERMSALEEELDSGFVWINKSGTHRFPILELHLYNMRHVQHHAAHLNLLLRQDGVEPPDWVSRFPV
ncbi:MAG: DinB family protein [Pyrinomonadaceae bacterium]